MVDNATLKNPNGLLPDSEKTTTLSGEKRTWTLRDSPEAGTYTLQAIVDTKEKERKYSLAIEQNKSIDIESAIQTQNIQENTVDLDENIDNTEDEAAAEIEEEEEIEEENTRAALNQKQESLAKKEVEEKKEKEGLGFGWFMIALIMALLFDTIGFLINFIPVAGQLIASLIITPIGLSLIWLMHVFSGVPLNTKAKSRLAITAVIEFIPIVQILPALTLCVLLSKAIPMLENRALDMANKLTAGQAKKVL